MTFGVAETLFGHVCLKSNVVRSVGRLAKFRADNRAVSRQTTTDKYVEVMETRNVFICTTISERHAERRRRREGVVVVIGLDERRRRRRRRRWRRSEACE